MLTIARAYGAGCSASDKSGCRQGKAHTARYCRGVAHGRTVAPGWVHSVPSQWRGDELAAIEMRRVLNAPSEGCLQSIPQLKLKRQRLRHGYSATIATRFFSFANGLRPSHSCIERAIALSPVSVMFPASISAFSVEMPIQTAVMLRSELRT